MRDARSGWPVHGRLEISSGHRLTSTSDVLVAGIPGSEDGGDDSDLATEFGLAIDYHLVQVWSTLPLIAVLNRQG